MITSSANTKVKLIRRLRERKIRNETGLCYVEGLRIIMDAIRAKMNIEFIIFSPAILKNDHGNRVIDELRSADVDIIEVGADIFQKMAIRENPQGAAAVIQQRWARIGDISSAPGSLWVALHETADPGNLGSTIRSSDAVGGMGILLVGNTVDPYDPTSIKASMGAIFHQHLVRVTFNELMEWKSRNYLPLIGTSDQADQDYHYFNYPDSMILMMGSERHGLTEEYRSLCDGVVSIPMFGVNDSLNLANAASVVLYEILNQQRDRKRINPL